ncbi:hypothetical protein AB0G32_11725 [Streptomyces sp. NPDC023723]|uniref:Rv1733c family protein n=1 Tax=Streptomyces sp. NPDC023723 TaxID=3154323 RepID=UPI0033DB3081
MSANSCRPKPLWRWRRNPMRRPVDVVEAWIVLVTWVVIAVGGTVTGLVTAEFADGVFDRQRAERQAVHAVVLTDVSKSTSAADGTHRATAGVRWTAPDGTTRTGRTLVPTGARSGSTVTLWQDPQGTLVPQPADPAEAAVEAALFGMGAALALSGGIGGASALARCRLERWRLGMWDKEWRVVGPRWSERTG